MPPRRALLALPLLFAACAAPAPVAPPPAARFATALERADEVAEQVLGRMDGFERRALREKAAIGFALNTPIAGGPPVTAAAGEVLAPAIAALATHAERLDTAATGAPAEVEAGADLLDEAAAAGLDRLRAAGIVVPDTERQAGIAGIAALVRGPARIERRDTAASLATAADAEFRAVVTLLRRVIGFDAGSGTRGALRARGAALDAAEARFLDVVRRDRGLGVAQRYALSRELAEAREGEPLIGTFEAMLAMLASAEAAHAAIAGGGGAAEVAALETAVARLAAYGAAAGGP